MGAYCGGDLGTGIIQEQRLFTLALGLVPPWTLDDVRLTVEGKWPAPHVNFPKGSFFPCPVCGQDCPLHDTQEKVWRHLDFSQHAAYLHARGPRVQYSEHGVHLVPVGIVAGVVRETDHRLWRVLEHYVEKARATVGNRRGHDYITTVCGSRGKAPAVFQNRRGCQDLQGFCGRSAALWRQRRGYYGY